MDAAMSSKSLSEVGLTVSLPPFLLYYCVIVTGTFKSFFMMQRWLKLCSNPMNPKLIGYPHYKFKHSFVKGHLFNSDQYSTSKHLYSLIPWSQQQHAIWVVTHGGRRRGKKEVSL